MVWAWPLAWYVGARIGGPAVPSGHARRGQRRATFPGAPGRVLVCFPIPPRVESDRGGHGGSGRPHARPLRPDRGDERARLGGGGDGRGVRARKCDGPGRWPGLQASPDHGGARSVRRHTFSAVSSARRAGELHEPTLVTAELFPGLLAWE